MDKRRFLQPAAVCYIYKILLIMAAGILGGVIVGAIPGNDSTMAVTLALPFTFYMGTAFRPIPSAGGFV